MLFGVRGRPGIGGITGTEHRAVVPGVWRMECRGVGVCAEDLGKPSKNLFEPSKR